MPAMNAGGEFPDGGIETSGHFIEFPSFNGNAVFRTLQLGLKFQEILVGLQIRITFNGYQQPGKRRTQVHPVPAGRLPVTRG